MILVRQLNPSRSLQMDVHSIDSKDWYMKRTVLLVLLGLTINITAAAHERCVCEQLNKSGSVNFEEINLPTLAEWEFAESFSTESVRGVLRAEYYYCDEEHGILVVNKHDKNIVYKNVPLNIWFEFRYSESVERYYRDFIKYQYIVVQSNNLSPKMGDTELSHIVQ